MVLTKQDFKNISTLLDEKLKPIKEDLGTVKKDLNGVKTDLNEVKTQLDSVKTDLNNVKDVVEREFKRVNNNMNTGFRYLNDKIDRLDNQLGAVIEDHEPRLKKLEEKTGINTRN